ncbi:EF-hand and coiled-coil domain-containing protein 1 isoform X2 [Puntigrus tetrazona]|uniref:EF-hand and coiled-coil domain-containing protein 1 isoform X2 n=1 Tax=Puntigrus tetrazona TaxID=1606681 RepID=UPI001C8AEE44|nr:EF-hand and coiled-coil domain-containing protein 1 isoform X2 [Puntigrus tetrazona]
MQVSRIRAARKSEWLTCALTHHFSPDPCVENEIVVLATGVDQYLQEVFHHLAFYHGDDLVSGEDFRSLCLILGIPESAETESATSEHRDVCHGLPLALNFKDFHARICGFFSLKAQEGQTGVRLPVSEETEHVEREIRLRCPRVRRRKCVSFDLSAEQQNRGRSARRSSQNPDHLQSSAVEPKRNAVDINPQRRWQDQLELENASLRELVEDLRSSLQSSDARCLALEVALRRKHVPSSQHAAGGTSEKQHCKTKTRRSKPTECDSRRSTKDLLRELELIRASRDGQLEEAMRFNQRLEEELMAAYGEISRMKETLDSVRTENTRIKKRTEEVRESLAAGLQGVRTLQDQARQADRLREQVQSLERFRAQCTCTELNMIKTEILTEPCGSGFSSPISHDEARREEDLQRSVEGRAASDEEEEEMSVDEGQCCHLEVKRLINRLHSCSKGCQKAAICDWLVSQSSAHSKDRETRVCIPQANEGGIQAGKMEQKEVESVRVYHSLLEERLTLLLQIPHKLLDEVPCFPQTALR